MKQQNSNLIFQKNNQKDTGVQTFWCLQFLFIFFCQLTSTCPVYNTLQLHSSQSQCGNLGLLSRHVKNVISLIFCTVFRMQCKQECAKWDFKLLYLLNLLPGVSLFVGLIGH